MSGLSVAVRHQHTVIRLGLIAMLATVPGIHLVEDDGPSTPDVLISQVPDRTAPEVAADLTGSVPILGVLPAGSVPVRPADLPAGYYGWVGADVEVDELVIAIRAVAAGQPYRPPAATTVDTTVLSPREREALLLIGEGLTHHQVARRMGVAKSTVETYVERIREKLCLGNKAELTRAALNLHR
jgi:two-component system invasion response regulator UvrY